MLWFDVGIVRYTTRRDSQEHLLQLWFDVGIVRYTTHKFVKMINLKLWFDVGIVRYTTIQIFCGWRVCCGLM